MRIGSLAVAAGLSAATLLLPAPVRADEGGYRHGRVYHVEPGVTLHRASEVGAEEALPNIPFLPGDRVWTDATGRVEFQFPDGTVARVDSRSKLDYAGHEEDRGERIVLRLWSGSLIVRLRSGEAGQFAIETPAGAVELLDRAMVRVDVEGGETRISTYRGEALFDDGRSRVRLAAGERTFARWGGEAAAPESFDVEPEDDFASWDDAREAEERQAARSSEYLPAELDPYAGELERNGSWRYEAAVGYVWTPRVAAGWSPYTSGQWSWTPYGWTWIPYETWGWAPSHYGRWGFSASFGWYWSPASVWGPAWVSWGVGGGYVGWCPLGFRDRPVFPWHGSFNRGHAVPRGRGHGGWNLVREGDFGLPDVARRRVPTLGVDPRSIRVADSAALRPTRDARALQPTTGRVRAISRRPTPGDFVRELAVDNRTTIPAPWLRRDQPRSGAATRGSREPSAAARSRSATTPPGSTEPQDRAGTASPRQRAVPWYTPRDESATAESGRGQASGRSAARREADAGQRGAAESRGSRETARSRTEPRAASPIGSLFERRERDSDARRPRPEAAQPRAERREAPRARENDGGQSRQRVRPADSGQRPQATRTERPSRTESSQAPRGESQARPRSNGNAGSSGGASSSRGGGGAGMRAAPRPSRPRN
jgi:hypothetical protein